MKIAATIGMVAYSCSVGLAAPQDSAPSIADLVNSLDAYEQSFHGLSFDVVSETRRNRESSIVRRESVSRNGRIRAWEGVMSGQTSSEGLVPSNREFGGRASADGGWVFRISRLAMAGVGDGELAMTVEFHPKGTASAIARAGYFQGFIENLSFKEYVQTSDSSVQDTQFSGFSVWALQCNHPDLENATFFFDKESRQLVGMHSKRTAGDKFGVGSIYVSPRILQEGQWVESTFGPIEYIAFAGSPVPDTVPFSGNSSEPNSRIEGMYRFENYTKLERDLTPKIEFDTIALPDDGERVTSQGEEGIRYELRGGEIVKVVDADARRSAARARFHRSGASRTVWYVAGAVLALGITGFLAHRWSRRE